MSFSQRVERLMADRAITQDQLAAALGVSRGSIGHWVAGRSTPRRKEMRKFEEVERSQPSRVVLEPKAAGERQELHRKLDVIFDSGDANAIMAVTSNLHVFFEHVELKRVYGIDLGAGYKADENEQRSRDSEALRRERKSA